MNAGYGYAMDQIRDTRHEPGVLCAALFLAAEEVPRDSGIPQVLIPDSKAIGRYAWDHRLLASRKDIHPEFLDAVRVD